MIILALAGLFAVEQPMTESPLQRADGVTIVAVTPEPPFGSGIFATFVGVTGRTEAGERQFLIPFGGPGQPHPAIGAVCTIMFRHVENFGGQVGPALEPARGGDHVDRYRCGDGPVVITELAALSRMRAARRRRAGH